MSERKHIQHYHSLTSGNVPAAEDLLIGEIAINVADGKIYTKNESNEVIALNEKQDLMVPIRYRELVTLRNEDKLIPGMKYRIIDYGCTTSELDTNFAGYRFDIIVTALNKNTLSEEASAIQNEYSYEEIDTDGNTYVVQPDTYFDHSDLQAWKLKYCLDNNIYRFNWAIPDKINDWALDPYYNLYKIDVSDNNVALQTNILWDLDGKSYYFWDSLNDTKYLTEYKTPYVGGAIYVFNEDSETISTSALTINSVEKWNAYGPTQDFSGNNVAYYFCKQNPQIGDTIYEINVGGRDEYYTFDVYSTTTVESVESDGTGVIYRMIDEFGNDCPYDFKNLLYLNGDGQWVFTFSDQLTDETYLDASVNRYGTGKVARNNKIEAVSSVLTYNNASNTFCAFVLPWNVLINPGNNNRFYNSCSNYIYKASGCEFINSNENFINTHYYSGIRFSNSNLVFKNSDQNTIDHAFTNVSFIACSGNIIDASNLWRPGNYEFKSVRDSEITVPDNDYSHKPVLTISRNSSGEVKIYNETDLIA